MKCFIPKLLNIVQLFYLPILGTVNSEVVTVFKTIRDVDGTVICRGRGGGILVEEFSVRSAIECSKVCAENEVCVGFNFRSGSKTCSLFPAGQEAFTREEQCRYFQSSNSIEIFLPASPHNGLFQPTTATLVQTTTTLQPMTLASLITTTPLSLKTTTVLQPTTQVPMSTTTVRTTMSFPLTTTTTRTTTTLQPTTSLISTTTQLQTTTPVQFTTTKSACATATHPPNYKTVNAGNCSYPYSFNGSIFYNCTKNVPSVTSSCYPYACQISGDRTWALCDISTTDFYSTYVTSNMTIAGSSVLATSINGWIIIHQFSTGSLTSFNRSWVNFTNGFGDLSGNYWFGNEKVYQLTKATPYRIRVEVQSNDTRKWYSAEYASFSLASSTNSYRLTVSSYTGGDAGESFLSGGSGMIANGMSFTTFDADHDFWTGTGIGTGYCCATVNGGGWWFNTCGLSTLTVSGGNSYWGPLQALSLAPTYNVRDSRMMIKL